MNLLVVKREQSRQGFERDKLLQSMQAACSKRPVSADALDEARKLPSISSVDVVRLPAAGELPKWLQG